MITNYFPSAFIIRDAILGEGFYFRLEETGIPQPGFRVGDLFEFDPEIPFVAVIEEEEHLFSRFLERPVTGVLTKPSNSGRIFPYAVSGSSAKSSNPSVDS